MFSGPWLTVVILAFYYYFDAEIADAVDDSRKISGLPDEHFERLKHELVVIPFWPHSAVGVVFGWLGIQAPSIEEGFTRIEISNVLVLLEWAVAAMITFGFAFRVIRLIILTVRIYSGPVELNMYNLPSIYHLSSAVSKAGLFLLLVWYLNLPWKVNEFLHRSDLGLSSADAVSLVPLAAFLVPQLVLSRRMVREKERLLNDVSLRLQRTFNNLQDVIDAERFEAIDPLRGAIETLLTQRRYIEGIPIFPWRLGTFRVTVTAVVLPVVVWIIQQILDMVIGFEDPFLDTPFRPRLTICPTAKATPPEPPTRADSATADPARAVNLPQTSKRNCHDGWQERARLPLYCERFAARSEALRRAD